MTMPFTLEQFLGMIEGYNEAFWPLQVLMYALGLGAVILAVRQPAGAGKAVSLVLAFLWLWVGAVFYPFHFAKLSALGYVFAAMFVLQGALFLTAVRSGPGLTFAAESSSSRWLGWLLVAYALLGYPTVEYLLGRGYPSVLLVGMAPCPTAILTLGILLWSGKRVPRQLAVIPVLHALSGVLPVYLGLVEDVGLVVAGVVFAVVMLRRSTATQVVRQTA